MFRKLILLAAVVLLSPSLAGCMPVGVRASRPDAGTPIVERVATADLTRGWIQTAVPTIATVVPSAIPNRLPATRASAPQASWKTFASTKHHYAVNYPGSWTVDVQTFTPPGPGRDPEGVYLRPPNAMWATVQVYALKGAPPVKGYENCTQNLTWKGLQACSLSLTQDPVPHKLLLFQKGESYYHVEGWYSEPQQLATFEEIVNSFQFTQ